MDGVSPQSFPPVTGGKAATADIKQVANPKGKSRVYFTQLKIAIKLKNPTAPQLNSLTR